MIAYVVWNEDRYLHSRGMCVIGEADTVDAAMEMAKEKVASENGPWTEHVGQSGLGFGACDAAALPSVAKQMQTVKTFQGIVNTGDEGNALRMQLHHIRQRFAKRDRKEGKENFHGKQYREAD